MKIAAHEEGKKELLLGRRTIAERIEAENIIIHAANFLPLLFHHPDGRTVFHRGVIFIIARTEEKKAILQRHLCACIWRLVIFAKAGKGGVERGGKVDG